MLALHQRVDSRVHTPTCGCAGQGGGSKPTTPSHES